MGSEFNLFRHININLDIYKVFLEVFGNTSECWVYRFLRFHGDISKMMCLSDGSGMEQAISEANDAMRRQGLPVASERAGGESRPCLDSSE